MSDRRERLLDAALDVVGTQGLRALTHRAVDARAQVPAGATSNLFRARRDLVAAMLGRLLELETAAWPDAGDAGHAVDPVELLVERVRLLGGPLRAVTVARLAMFGEAAVDPTLREQIADGRARVEREVRDWLGGLGLAVDPAVVTVLLSTVNGLLLERIAMPPERAVDPGPAIRHVLRDAIGASRM